MAKVSISDTYNAPERHGTPGNVIENGKTQALFDRPSDPIHAHVHTLQPHGHLAFTPLPVDRVAFVWQGYGSSGTTALGEGSCVIVERQGAGAIDAREAGATIVTFASAEPLGNGRAGGATHVLPAEHVPWYRSEDGMEGALYADGACKTCSAWLHANSFKPMAFTDLPSAEVGIHSHSENEVIFVTAGAMRLGRKLVGSGTAIAIAANTLYSFTAGPDGLRFLNFRAEQPAEIRFKNGATMDEVGFWRERVVLPAYF